MPKLAGIRAVLGAWLGRAGHWCRLGHGGLRFLPLTSASAGNTLSCNEENVAGAVCSYGEGDLSCPLGHHRRRKLASVHPVPNSRKGRARRSPFPPSPPGRGAGGEGERSVTLLLRWGAMRLFCFRLGKRAFDEAALFVADPSPLPLSRRERGSTATG